ncbi:hypothetical protein B0H16DRAFT_1736451 [Mycena metata]|uniref:Ubiquitin-like protease family profile domain-containing protein n=1 Tax=Mycena metata TaxID=1033252 RepID=A0AAD7HPK5_9AGAR|nr:hypothetical protein B0H16DRAFT_1736451 [Mycena metata]
MYWCTVCPILRCWRYTRHDFSQPDEESSFKVAITDDFSTDSMIANTAGPDGLFFLDSTHRLQNENRAATTVLCTANTDKHMMPGAYLISANIQAETIKDWLSETITKIIARAHEVVKDKSKIKHRTPDEQERIFARCQEIVRDGFKFKGFMIDKSTSELNALLILLRELNMDDVYIRLCQFHVIQAILNWDSEGRRAGIGYTLSHEVKFEICVLFRSLQRCRTWEIWPASKQKFYEGLEALLGNGDGVTVPEEESGDGDLAEEDASGSKKPPPQPKTKAAKASGLTCFETVKAYFDKNWFIERWIPYFTDIGMPSDQSRDGVWNTNNWSETAFKQFNTIFLDNKHNKRIDRLASIILNDHLPYFCYFPTPNRPEAREVVQMNLEAEVLWENDLVHHIPAASKPQTYTVAHVSGQDAIEHTVVLDPLECTCRSYDQYGKICVDIAAARLLRSNGPIAAWLKAESATEKTAPEKAAKAVRMRDDDTANAELNKILARLAKANKLSHSDDLNGLDFGDSKVHNGSGRPPKIRALQPWRSKHRRPRYVVPGTYSYSPRFTKKRGPPKMRRLAPNSLFPATQRLRNARRAFWNRQYHRAQQLKNAKLGGSAPDSPSASPSPDPPAAEKPAPSHDNDEFLNPEDLSLGTFTFDRWSAQDYELQMDEMHVFITCLNQSSFADQAGILFLLRTMKMGHLADLLAVRNNLSINHLVFFQLFHHHWTVFHHIINYAGGGVRWFNSLPASGLPGFMHLDSLFTSTAPLRDIQDQLVVQQYFARPRPVTAPPRALSQAYTAVHLGLQHDGYTCGFWAVYVAFSILLGFNPDNAEAHRLNGQSVKELTGTIYAAFVGHEDGVSMALVQALFARFQPTVFTVPPVAGAMMSLRPVDMARAPSHASTSQVPAPVMTGPLSSPVLVPDFKKLILAPNNAREQWVVGNTIMHAGNLGKLVNRGKICDGIVDGFFWCYVQDVLVATGQSMDQLPFFFMERKDCEPLIVGPRARSATTGMPPPPRRNARLGARKRWFEQFDVFQRRYLIIPVFWKALEHWLLAAVFFEKKEIRVYDSIFQKTATRPRAVYQRVREMLVFEHRALYGTSLPEAWPQYSAEAIPQVPQQDNDVDCAVFTIVFGVEIAEGRLPDDLKYGAANVEHERIRIANHLSAAIHADRDNWSSLGIAPDVAKAPQTPVEQQPPTSPAGGELCPYPRQIVPSVGRHILMPLAGQTSGFLFPARVIYCNLQELSPKIGMEWCSQEFLSLPKIGAPVVPSGLFTCTFDEWKHAANRTLQPSQVLPLQWPAALEYWPGKWSHHSCSFIPPSDTADALFDCLESALPTIVLALEGTAVPDPGLMLIMDNAAADPVAFIQQVQYMCWMPPPGHRTPIEVLADRLTRAAKLVPHIVKSADHLEKLTDGSITVYLLGSTMLWSFAIAFLTATDSTSGYRAICEGRVRWPRMEIQSIWAAYQEVCELPVNSDPHPTLQVVVPGISIPDLQVRPLKS